MPAGEKSVTEKLLDFVAATEFEVLPHSVYGRWRYLGWSRWFLEVFRSDAVGTGKSNRRPGPKMVLHGHLKDISQVMRLMAKSK